MPRDHRPTERFGARQPHYARSWRDALSTGFDLTSSCSRECVSCVRFLVCGQCALWALASITNTSFIVNPRSHIIDKIPFDSDAPNAAAYNSASVLLLAMILCCGCLQLLTAEQYHACT